MRPVFDPTGGPDVLVEKMIGQAYETVKRVYCHLPEIKRLDTVLTEIPTLAQTTVDAAVAEAMPPILEQLREQVQAAENWAGEAEASAEAAAQSAHAATKVNMMFPFTSSVSQMIYDVTVISGQTDVNTVGMALWVGGSIVFDFTILSATTFMLNNATAYPENTQMRVILNAHFNDLIHGFDQLLGALEQEYKDAAELNGRWCGVHLVPPTTRLNGDPFQEADEYQNRSDKLRYSWSGSGWVALNSSAQQLEARLVSPVGSTISGHVRTVLSKAIETVGDALNATPVSMWEPTFVNTVTDRPDPLKPAEWDWSPAFAALDVYAAIVGRIEVRLPKELTVKSGVTVDVNRVVLAGPSKINCKLPTPGTFAVTFSGESATSPYFHNLESARNIEFAGNGISNGLRFMGSSSIKAASHLLFNSLNVHDFVDGYSFFNNSYILNFLNCDGFNCTGNVFYMPGGSTNAGERITIIGGTYYNSNRILYAGSGEWYFTNSSFDFSKHLVFAQGMVTFNDCHGEFITGEGYDNIIEVTYFDNMGYQPKCSVIIKGGEWLNLATKSNYVVKFVNTTTRLACRCVFDRVFAYNIQPLSGYWATGNGRLYVTGLATSGWNAAMTPLTHVDNNLLADGGFEDVSATPLDAFYVSADAGGVTGRHTSGNLTVSTSSSYSYEGTKSLKIARTGGLLSSATVSLLVPLTENTVGMRFKMNKPTAGAGTLRIEAYWALAGDLYGAGAPVVRKTLFVDTGASYVFTGATDGWIDYTAFTGWQDMIGMIKYNRPTKEKPSWANCIQIRIVTAGMNATAGTEELYFDKFEVYEL